MGEPDGSLGDRSNKTVTFKLADGKGGEQTVSASTDSNGHAATSAALPPGTYRSTVSLPAMLSMRPVRRPPRRR